MQRTSLALPVILALAVLACLGLLARQQPALSQAAAPPAGLHAASASPNYCQDYQMQMIAGTSIVSGTSDIGNHTDDGETQIALPFPYQVYSQTFTTVNVSSNGRLDFASRHDPGATGYGNVCLPVAPDANGPFDFTIFAHWDDLETSADPGCGGYASGCGVFTSVTGIAPNRVFNIEWRAVYFNDTTTPVNFEAQLYEGQTRFDLLYGTVPQHGTSATIGVQGSQQMYTQYLCNTCGVNPGLDLSFSLVSCGLVTPVPIATCVPTVTPTAPPTRTPTRTPSPTPTGSPPPPPAAGPIAGGPGIQDKADVDANLVVWEDNSAGTWDIKGKDLSTGQSFVVAQGAGDQQLPAVQNNLIVWQDNAAGNWDIYGARVLPGDAVSTPFPIATGPGDQTAAAVSGNMVAWQSVDGGLATIMVEDVTVGQPRAVSDQASTSTSPAIDGALVVWQSVAPTGTGKLKSPASSGWNIMGTDLSGPGSIFQVTTGISDHVNAAINGDLVVWQEEVNDQFGAHWAIRGNDLTTHETFNVTNAPGDQIEPAISDGEVVYVGVDAAGLSAAPLDCGSGTRRRAVRGTGARSGGSDDTPISAYGCSASRPRTRGGRDVWDQDPPGASAQADIYGNACTIGFSDVHAIDYFYVPVQALTCAGAISGYGDNTFRPYNDTTRGQLAKIIVLGEGWALDTSGGPHFNDVPTSNPFYAYIETAYNRGIISGYGDGSFRWGANVTRGQLCKIIVGAQGWAINTSGGPHFNDVPTSNPFYAVIETAFNHGIISGYGDGSFRWGANATRGQIAKIAWGALSQP